MVSEGLEMRHIPGNCRDTLPVDPLLLFGQKIRPDLDDDPIPVVQYACKLMHRVGHFLFPSRGSVPAPSVVVAVPASISAEPEDPLLRPAPIERHQGGADRLGEIAERGRNHLDAAPLRRTEHRFHVVAKYPEIA